MTALPIGKLVKNEGQVKGVPRNPRQIKDTKYEYLKKSLEEDPEFTKLNPILVYDNLENFVVMGGNMRYQAAKDLGWKEIYASVMPNDTPPELIVSRIIKHNADYGEDDWDLVANEWSDYPLEEWGMDLPGGWKDDDIEEDEAPPVSLDPAISKEGEIYQLGEHRLMCGDSTDFGAVSELLNGQLADLVFTDPPYGVDYTGKTKDALKINNDKTTKIFAEALPNMITASKPGASFYICCPAGNNFKDYLLPFDQYCYQSSTIIWAKNSMVLGHGDYHYQHEPILYGWNKEGSHKFYGPRNQTTVWNIDRPAASRDHPTTKPLALSAKAMTNSSKEGDIVLDVFGGSGSTLLSAQQLNRVCYMMELDPKYCDVIRKRYWKFINEGNEEGWIDNTPVISGGTADNGS